MKSCSPYLLAGCLAAPVAFGQSIWGVDAAGVVASQAEESEWVDPLAGEDAFLGGAGWHSDQASAGDARGSFLSAGTVLSDPRSFFALSTFAATSEQDSPMAAVEASVTAVESFIFEGDASQALKLGVSLEGIFANSLVAPSSASGNFATVSILRAGPGADPRFAYATTLGEWTAAGYEIVESVALEQSDAQTLTAGSIAVTAHPGEVLFVFAEASSRMFGPDGVADASSTLTVGWLGPMGGLRGLSGAGDLVLIPEPRAMAGLLALFAGLAVGLRRRR